MADLDTILSGASAVAPENPEVVKETPAVVEQAPAEQATDAPEVETQEGEQGQKMVPQQALHAEKQKVKRYTEQVASFEQSNAELRQAIARLEAKVSEQAKPKEPEKPAPQFWDSPDEYVQHSITPVQQALQKELAETRYVLSRNVAIASFGEETVNAADEALTQAVQSGQLNGQAVRQQLEQSRDPVGDVVRWHKNSPAMKEQEMRDRIRAEVLAEIQGGNQQQGAQAQQAAPVMPSNLAAARNVGSRSGPAWSGPQSLNDIFDRSRKQKA